MMIVEVKINAIILVLRKVEVIVVVFI